jgi:uncharacterized protein (TIGR03435 family)
VRKIAITVIAVLSGALAQTPDISPQFEVASIKASPPPDPRGFRMSFHGGPGTDDPGLFTCENWGLSGLITLAYDIQDYQLSGPDWMSTTRFMVSAKIPPGTTNEQFHLMLQNLLAERFKLALHREKKEMQAYSLVVSKNGHKLKQSPAAQLPLDDDPPKPFSASTANKDENGFPILPPGRQPMMMAIKGGYAVKRFANESMESLAQELAGQLRHPVIDDTGLQGKYDFTMNWIMGGALATDDTGPTIFAALQQQLGLKLESKKGMVDIFIVDRIEKTPTEN